MINGKIVNFFHEHANIWKTVFPAAGLVILISLGWWTGEQYAGALDSDMRERLRRQAIEIADTINPDLIKKLTFTSSDKGTPVYEQIREQMISYGRIFMSINNQGSKYYGIYSMILRDGNILFGPENIDEKNPLASLPGTVYDQPPPGIYTLFNTGRSFTVGPFTDEYGTFVSTFAPVYDKQTGKVVMAIGVDIMADDWQASLDSVHRKPLLAAIVIIMLIAAGAVVLYRRNRTLNPENIKFRVWVVAPVGLFSFIVLLFSGLFGYWQFDVESERDIRIITEQTRSSFGRSVAFQIQIMKSKIDSILENQSIIKAWETGDFETLKTLAVPLFGKLKNEYDITHFYFISAEGVCFLRVHQPERRGDLIYRSTLLAAKRTGESSWGIELGPLGTLTLRYVKPVIRNNRIRGYIELGVEIEYLTAQLSKDMNVDILTVIAKNFISRDNYEAGRREFNFAGEWDANRSFVIAHQTIDYIPSGVAGWIEQLYDPLNKTDSFISSHAGKKFSCGVIPLFDLKGGDSSRLVVIKDITIISGSGLSVLILDLSLAAAIFGGILLLLWSVTGAAERQMGSYFLQIRKSEEKFRSMFENHSSIMMLVDPETANIVNVNPPAEKFYGYTAEQLKAMKVMDINILPADHVKMEMEQASEYIRNYFQFQHRLSSGEIRFVEVHSSPVLIDDRKMLFSIINDITDRKNLEDEIKKSNEMFRTLSVAIDQSPVAVVMTDISGNIEFVNPKFVETTGYTAEEAIGQNPRILKSGDKSETEYRELWDTILSGKNWHGIFKNKKKNGDIYWESSVISPVRDDSGNIIHFLAVKEDITERMEIENKLREEMHNSKNLREQAEAANRSKSDFLAAMSHEIRTPMNGVISMTGLLMDMNLTEKQLYYARIIRSSGESLLSLINDILDFSKIEAYKMDLEILDFHLTKTMNDTIELMKVKADEKRLLLLSVIDSDIPQFLRGDPGRLRQILINLIGNAIKFTSEGKIELHVSMQEDIGDWVRLQFCVSDTGIGIPLDKQENIFSPFIQADSSITRKYGGTGLGLAISKDLVEIMGGNIEVESEKGKGSTFRFTAIFEKQSPEQVRNSMEYHKVDQVEFEFILNNNARILLAEDNNTNQIVAVEMLKKLGFEKVDVVASGVEALTALKSIDYDLVFMDCHMPEMDGFEATRLIRGKQSGVLNPDIPVIALTALVMTLDRDKAIEAGMNDYLIKPVELTDLAKMLNKWITPVSGNLQGKMALSSIETEDKILPDITNVKEKAPVFNRSSFVGRLMGDEDLVARIIRIFLDDMPSQIEKLAGYIDACDSIAAGHQAHRISGSAANVSGEAMHDIAFVMEQAGAAGDLETLKKFIPNLKREFLLLKEEMEKEV